MISLHFGVSDLSIIPLFAVNLSSIFASWNNPFLIPDNVWKYKYNMASVQITSENPSLGIIHLLRKKN